jgi:hypothetical protein
MEMLCRGSLLCDLLSMGDIQKNLSFCQYLCLDIMHRFQKEQFGAVCMQIQIWRCFAENLCWVIDLMSMSNVWHLGPWSWIATANGTYVVFIAYPLALPCFVLLFWLPELVTMTCAQVTMCWRSVNRVRQSLSSCLVFGSPLGTMSFASDWSGDPERVHSQGNCSPVQRAIAAAQILHCPNPFWPW